MGHDVVGVDALTDYYDPRLKRDNLRRHRAPAAARRRSRPQPARPRAAARRRRGRLPPGRAARRARLVGPRVHRYTRDNVDATQTAAGGGAAARRGCAGSSTRRPHRSTATPRGTRPGDRPPAAAEPVRGHQAGRRAPVRPLRGELRPADGPPALLHRVRAPVSGPTWPSPGSAGRSATASAIELFGTRPAGARLHLHRRRGRGEPAGRRGTTRRHGRVFNVAGGTATTVNEVLELLGEISGREVRVTRAARGTRGRGADRRQHRGPAGRHRVGPARPRCARASRSSTGGSPPSLPV